MYSTLLNPTRTRLAARLSAILAALSLAFTLVTVPGCGQKNVLAPELTELSAAQASRAEAQELCNRGGRREFRSALHLEGVSETGALWQIDRPAKWNGDLVLYLHGYTNPALPLALPNNGPIRDSLMARGYAVAASSFSSNGYAVEEGMRDSRALARLFQRRVAHPRHTLLFGQSLGGLIGLLLAQRDPEQFDGAMLVSGIVGGSREEVQYIGDIRVLFDTVYPGVLAGDLEHPPVITDLNAQVIQPVAAALSKNPQGLGVIQSLARRPLPGANGNEIATSLINVLGFAMQGGGDLLARTHGETFFDNADWHYDSAALPPALVADVNARVARYTRTAGASAFLDRFGAPSSELRQPMLTLHATRDPIVPAFHEDILTSVAGGPRLIQVRPEGYGHTNFTTAVLMQNFDQLRAAVAAPERERDLAFN